MTHIPIANRHLRLGVAAICALGGALALALSAFASTPEPTAMIAAARAITIGDQMRVAAAISPKLKEARGKLTAAQNTATPRQDIQRSAGVK
jgi:non-ribosomal peptide synthetase component E (peptide arylation enzyme)